MVGRFARHACPDAVLLAAPRTVESIVGRPNKQGDDEQHDERIVLQLGEQDAVFVENIGLLPLVIVYHNGFVLAFHDLQLVAQVAFLQRLEAVQIPVAVYVSGFVGKYYGHRVVVANHLENEAYIGGVFVQVVHLPRGFGPQLHLAALHVAQLLHKAVGVPLRNGANGNGADE